MSRWTVTRAAAAGAAALVLCGASPCHAFLAAGHIVLSPQHQPCRNIRCSSRANAAIADGDLSRTPDGAVAAPEFDDQTTAAVDIAARSADAKGPISAKAGQRWIKEMKPGDKVIGYVSDTTKFAAFVDCSVVRRGAKDKVVPVTGFLHLSEIRRPYALKGTPRAGDCEVEVKKGIHLTAYVKDVFPNAGRMTLSLDPDMTRDKVRKLRDSTRQRSRNRRRERIHKSGQKPAVGDIVEGIVRKVEDSMVLVDVMFAQLSVLRAVNIRNSSEGGEFVNLLERAKPGDAITVRIESIKTTGRRGPQDDKATIAFVRWGGIDAGDAAAAAAAAALAADNSVAAAGEQQSHPFDLAAEIEALPAARPWKEEASSSQSSFNLEAAVDALPPPCP